MINVRYSNNSGDGICKIMSLEDNETIGSFIEKEGLNFTDYSIRVNRNKIEKDYILQQEDKITVIPQGIRGAYL